MAAYMDYFNVFFMGSVQMLLGFYFFIKLLHKKVRFCFYLLFVVCGVIVIYFVPSNRIIEFGVYVLLLVMNGIVVCRSDWKSVILYAALVVEIMQICYGIVNSLLGLLYPLVFPLVPKIIGIVFMLLGDITSLILAGFCYHVVHQYFSYYETIKKQYVFLVLIPIMMIFFMGEYINSILYSVNTTDESGIIVYPNHFQMLVIQFLGIASLFCIMFAYKKLLQNFRLSTELSLLEREERFLKQYVEEAKTHYDKTKSFRHDIKNHITVVKKLLQNEKSGQALNYIGDMEEYGS